MSSFVDLCFTTYCLKCESGSSRFQLGEGPSRGLLRDYELSDGPSFQALEILPKEYVQKLRVCPSSALIR